MSLGHNSNMNRTAPMLHPRAFELSEKPIDLYYSQLSPKCRAVMMVGLLLKVEFNLINVDLGKHEHHEPKVARLNPQENIPFINDHGFILTESIAIMCYLAEKFQIRDSLLIYPTDLQKRALVHQKLCFDRGTLYERFADLYFPMFFEGARFDADKKNKLDQGYIAFNKYLAKADPWVDGKFMTIADIALAATVSTAEAAGYEVKDYANVMRWFEHAKKHIPNYNTTNQPGVDAFKNMVKRILNPKKRASA